MTNVNDPDGGEARTTPGFVARRARVGWELATERLGASVWEIAPGEAAYPYHYHLSEEELVLVLEGRPSVRTATGWRQLEPGELCSFPTGEAGAHQIANWSEAPARFLAVSTSGTPDICVYPDSGKLGTYERRPSGGGLSSVFRASDAVGYQDGESPPTRPA